MKKLSYRQGGLRNIKPSFYRFKINHNKNNIYIMTINNKLLIFSTTLFFILISCSNKNKVVLNHSNSSFANFPKEQNVSFENLFEYKVGTPKAMKLVDSTLIIFNSTKKIKSFFYNYSIKSGQISRGYLHKGRGPKEALGASCFGIVDNILWVHDVTLKKIFIMDKKEILSGNISSFKAYPLEGNYYQISVIDNSSILINGKIDSNYKIQEINFSERLLNEFGEFENLPKDLPLDALKDAYHSFFFLSPSKDKVAISYLYTDLLEIYNLKSPYENETVQGPEGINIEFEIGKRQYYNYMKKNEGIRKTFLAGAVTDKHIYLAYSGLSYAERNDINYCKYVYVYDWNGTPVKKLNLNKRIMGLAVSGDDRTIYSYDADTGFIVKAEIE
ncbi:hypothetical protein JL193_04495 [Polaribacter batillariae]|uniref:TolB-like 6-blade propeller-like n=1 Tax=Polaribacter batillariae TaxID=2808900 RepID=A0ABX7SWC8_9FLAO|nr:BF3164 family lipoprotein [Polaribacter batillariae]QTD38552.1 hypothetical protein JL193_04495 [Polaribacter batillariae]